MKILQINNYHHVRGGADRVYFETSKLLEKHGHKVLFFSIKDQESEKHYSDKYFVKPFNYENIGYLKKIKMSAQFIYNQEARNKLELIIQNEKPDIAHLHIFVGYLSSSILPILKKYNIPTVMSVHDFRMLCPISVLRNSKGEICEKCADGNYLHCIIEKCSKNNLAYSFISAVECYVRDQFFSYEEYIDKFIMVSQFTMDKHVQYRPLIVQKCKQIYNFIDLNKCPPSIVHENYYLYFGRLSHEKGVMTLLRAWRNFPDVQLKIVGVGDIEKDAKQYIDDYQMSNVEMVGFLNGDPLFDIVKRSKFIIVPSECYENNPMTIIEGFALGKPVIGARIGGIPELIKEDFNGYLFDSGNLDNLIDTIKRAESVSGDNYEILGKNARGFAEENFNETKHYDELIKLYEEQLKTTISHEKS